MTKRLLYIVVAVALMSAIVAKAALPALIIPVAEAVQALVIRSAGRQAIIELSTAAANDTTFAAAVTAVRGTQVAAWLGFGAVAAAYPVNTDIPVAPTLATEKYSVAVGPIGTNYKPAYISPGYKLEYPRGFESSSESWKVYGKTREDAIAAFIEKAKLSSDFKARYGTPTGWAIYPQHLPQYWADMNKLDWSIQIYTDKDGYRQCPGNDCGKPWDVYPADPVEPRDGQRRILLDGTKFKADIEDPDWSSEEARDFALQSGFGFVTKGSSNEPVRVGISTDGANIRIQEDVQTQSPDGKPQVVSRALDIAPGTGQATSTTAASQVGATLETLPANWSPSTSGQGTNGSGWPDDYARQATLASVDTGIGRVATATDAIKDVLTKKEEIEDPLLPDMAEVNKEVTYFDQFKDLLAWRLPSVQPECPTLEYQNVISGYTFDIVIDAHCTLMTADHQRMIDAIMIAVWSIMALWIILEA